MFQIGSVGSLLQDVVAITETVHTFAEALVYDVRALIPISQLVSHPRITMSIIFKHFLTDLKIRRTVFNVVSHFLRGLGLCYVLTSCRT